MAPMASHDEEGNEIKKDVADMSMLEKQLAEQVALAKRSNQETGLTASQVEELFKVWGKNELPEKIRNPFLIFLSYFTGPMPTMIWVAIIIELVKAIIISEGWEDFAVLMILQFANATIGFLEEFNAGNAIAALKSALKPMCYVCRDGVYKSCPAYVLVPGDLIKLKLGDVLPADGILLEKNPVEVDQAALTGESLPVTVHQWGHLKMGSALKRGEGEAIVTATGSKTFLGTAAKLIDSVQGQGHLQAVLLKITAGLLGVSVILCTIIGIVLGVEPTDVRHITDSSSKSLGVISIVIVILVASIPIAIEIVCTSTLAVGSHMMAERKVIVARLSAIEELAGMTILCSDKTGTLTLNELSLKPPIIFDDHTNAEDLNVWGSLCSRRDAGTQDAIDKCICDAVPGVRRGVWDEYEELHFEPFNPTDKRVVADLKNVKTGVFLQVAKGAPHMILRMAYNKAEIEKKVMDNVQELADRGFRSLGVTVNKATKENPKWEYLGILSLFDPPRPDTKQTIKEAVENGIEVKMITGDHTAIAKETCRELGMGTKILNTHALDGDHMNPKDMKEIDKAIMASHGFAEVMPEHKFLIVERIRQMGHVTGMTGDGVNDAPALKRADVGIAVFPCTDAAKAAADLVLTEPGLGVVIFAILESRKIFQRMRNYIIYRIACTVQLLCFFFFAILCVLPDGAFMYGSANPINYGCPTITAVMPASLGLSTYDWGLGSTPYNVSTSTINPAVDQTTCTGDLRHAVAFTLPVISLVIITILNDGCMITISHDIVTAEKRPQVWSMLEMTFIAMVLGWIACISSLLLVAYCMHANQQFAGDFFGHIFGSSGRNYITWYELRTIIYLKVSISDFLTLFCARTRTWFFMRRVGKLLGGAAVIAMTMSTLLSLFWDSIFGGLGASANMQGLRFSNGACISVWIYCLVWFIFQDVCKVYSYIWWDWYTGAHDGIQHTVAENEIMEDKRLHGVHGVNPMSHGHSHAHGHHGHSHGHGHGAPAAEPVKQAAGDAEPAKQAAGEEHS